MNASAPCFSKGRRCGTPSGWRYGGRCPRCREAHNAESRRLRARKNAPAPEVVAELARRVEAAEDLTEVARDLGVDPRTARVALRGLIGEEAPTVCDLVDHLLAVAEGRKHDHRAVAWRKAAPTLVDLEAILTCPDPRQREIRDGKRAIVAALEAGALTLREATDCVGLGYTRVSAWHARDDKFRAACDAARGPGFTRRAVDDAPRSQAAQLSSRRPLQQPRMTWDSKGLNSLIALLEQGATIPEALKRLKRTRHWLSRALEATPEVAEQVKAAAATGREKRKLPKPRRPQAPADRDAQAKALIVGAIAAGGGLSAAAKAGGAVLPWVASQYQRDDKFRSALLAAAALYDYDLAADIEEVEDWNQRIPAPRPPVGPK